MTEFDYLNVPRKQVEALIAFALMGDLDADKVINAFQNALPNLSHENFVASIVTSLESSSINLHAEDIDLEFFVKALVAVYQFKESESMDSMLFSKSISETFLNAENIEISDEDAVKLQNRLALFFETANSIQASLNTVRLAKDHQNIFIESKIQSDIRPIFDDDIYSDLDSNESIKLTGFAIVHTLKIVYRDIGGNKEYFVALEFEDLSQLAKQIEKALKKEIELSQFLEASGGRLMKFDLIH